MAEKKVKKLYRSKSDRMIAGVCGGLGEYSGIDPTVWRVIFFTLLIAGIGSGFVLYLVMWVVVPYEEAA